MKYLNVQIREKYLVTYTRDVLNNTFVGTTSKKKMETINWNTSSTWESYGRTKETTNFAICIWIFEMQTFKYQFIDLEELQEEITQY
jgi:hypothetical protein